MSFLELSFSPIQNENERSLLIAELMEAGFDSFNEEEDRLLAYISSDLFHKGLLDGIGFLRDHHGIICDVHPMEDVNWNKEWESNYQSVTIAGKCHVRAPFHPQSNNFQYEIVIEPKMAFGTAHHETTQLVAAWLMELDVTGKNVMDMGCGTGILAILANKMGALSVTGIDNDEWAWKNAAENFRINGLDENDARPGDAGSVEIDRYDIFIANINRNILLRDMEAYVKGLKEKGILLMSGFYEKDIEAITARASEFGLNLSGFRTLNDWAVILFTK